MRALCLQALESGDGGLAERADEWLSEEPAPLVMPVWTADRVPSALTRTLLGHAKPIERVALEPGGETAVSTDIGGHTVVWDLATGLPLSTSRQPLDRDPHPGRATSDDGATTIIGDLTGFVWRKHGERMTRCSHAHYQRVWSVAISGDGSRGVSGGMDGTLRVWDLRDGRQTHLFRQPGEGVRAVAITGTRVLSGDTDGTLYLWDLDGEPSNNTFGLLTPQLRQAPEEYGPLVWNLRQARPVLIGRFPLEAEAAQGRHWSRVITADWAPGLFGMDHEPTRGPFTIDRARHNGPVLFLAVDARRQMITSGGADGTIRTWDLRNGCPWGVSGGPTGLVEVIGDSLSVLHEVPGYSRWSRRDRRLRRTADRWDATPRPPTAMAVNQRGTRVITGSGDWHVRAWDLKHGRRLPLRDEMSRHTSPIRAVALTPKGDRAATIDASGHLKLWLVRRGLPYSEQSFPANATVAISGDMSHVITLKDDVVHVWPVTTDTTRAHRVSASVEAGRAVAISGDGRVALADSGDRELLVWDVRAGRLRCRADGLLGPVESIVTDATGAYAATMSAEGIVQIWRPAEGTCLLTFAAPRPVTAWALASGGSLPGVALVLGGDGGALSAFQIVP